MNKVTQQFDKLLDTNKIVEAHQLITDAERHYKDPEIYWRIGYACYGMIFYRKTAACEHEYDQYSNQGFDCTKMGMEINPNHAKCITWNALFLDMVSRKGGMKQRIQNCFTMHEYWTKSLQLEPDYYVTNGALGTWCFIVSDLNPINRLFARIFFTNPPYSTYEEAFQYLTRSNELHPDYVVNTLITLAKCCKRLNQPDKAIEYCKKVLSHFRDCHETDLAKEQALSILKKLENS